MTLIKKIGRRNVAVRRPRPVARADYKANDPRGWGGDPKRGAAMGRHSIHDVPRMKAVSVILREVPVHQDGYDSNGTYFGTLSPGERLFWYTDGKGTLEDMLRLKGGIDAAKRAILAKYPRATFQKDSAKTISDSDIDMMLAAYMEAALSFSTDGGDDPLDKNYNENDIADSTKKKMRRDVAKFLRANAADVNGLLSDAGQDFFLSRTERGGFNDGDWPEPAATRLHKAAKAFGGDDLYVGDDGKIY